MFGRTTREAAVGEVHVHEFMSLDGVIDTPVWTFDYGFDPRMGEAIGAVTARSEGILLGRTTYEMFEPSWSTRTAEDDPGAPFFNDTTKYVVSSTLTRGDLAELGDRRALRPGRAPRAEGEGRRRPLRQRQRHARAGDARRRPRRRAAPVRVPAHARVRAAPVPRRSRAAQARRSRRATRTRTASSTWATGRRAERAAAPSGNSERNGCVSLVGPVPSPRPNAKRTRLVSCSPSPHRRATCPTGPTCPIPAAGGRS